MASRWDPARPRTPRYRHRVTHRGRQT
jgi:hypothetical protein